MNNKMVVYGTSWCPDIGRVRRHPESPGADYEFVDLDRDEDGEQKVIGWNDGRRRVPTIVTRHNGEEEIFGNPPSHQIDSIIESQKRGERHESSLE